MQKYQPHTSKSQISLMAAKLAKKVGDYIFPLSDEEERVLFFEQMLSDLSLLASKDGCVSAGCGLQTIKALLLSKD